MSVSNLGTEEHRLVEQGLVRPRQLPARYEKRETPQERAERHHYERRGQAQGGQSEDSPKPTQSQRTEAQSSQISQTKTGIPQPK